MLKKLGRFFGYWSFFWIAFLFFAYHTFPYERLRDRLVQEAEFPRDARGIRRPSGLHVEVESITPSWLTGVEARGVHITKTIEDDDADLPPADLTLEELNARVSLLSLLTGDNELTFDAVGAGGTVTDGFVALGETRVVRATINDINLRLASIVRAFFSLPLYGTLNGNIDITLPPEPREARGSVDITGTNIRIGNGTAKFRMRSMRSGFTVERINAGRMRVKLEIEEGIAQIRELRSRGQDAQLDGQGRINLMNPLRQSRLDVLIRVKLLDAYRNRSDRTRALMGLLDAFPSLSRARTTDGALQLQLGGSFGGGIRSTGARSQRMDIAPDDEEDEAAAAPQAAVPNTSEDD